MSTVETTRLLTAEQFFELPHSLGSFELVRGELVRMISPGFRHGNICRWIAAALSRYLETHDIGDFALNDSGVVTERGPDSVRGPDIAFYSYQRLPLEDNPEKYPEVAPEIVWEVLSPSDRWTNVLGKVHEYLEANELVVCLVEPERKCVITYYPDRPAEQLQIGDTWREPAILPGFELPLEKIFRRGRK